MVVQAVIKSLVRCLYRRSRVCKEAEAKVETEVEAEAYVEAGVEAEAVKKSSKMNVEGAGRQTE